MAGNYGLTNTNGTNHNEAPFFLAGKRIKSKTLSLYNQNEYYITEDGNIYSSGLRNEFGELGGGTLSIKPLQFSAYPVLTRPDVNVSTICTGYHHIAALSQERWLYLWGKSDEGYNLGATGLYRDYGDVEFTLIPTLLLDIKNITSIACGEQITLAVTGKEVVYFWGSSGFDVTDRLSPFPKIMYAAKNNTIEDITYSNRKVLLLLSNGEVLLFEDFNNLPPITLFKSNVEKIYSCIYYFYLIHQGTPFIYKDGKLYNISIGGYVSEIHVDYLNTRVFFLFNNGSLYQIHDYLTKKSTLVFDDIVRLVGWGVYNPMTLVDVELIVEKKDGKIYTNRACEKSFFLYSKDDEFRNVQQRMNPSKIDFVTTNKHSVQYSGRFYNSSLPIKKTCEFGVFMDVEGNLFYSNDSILVMNTLTRVDFDCAYKYLNSLYVSSVINNGSLFYDLLTADTTGQPVFKLRRVVSIDNDPITQVCMGRQHTVLLTRNHNVYTFGENSMGQLGSGGRKGSPDPQKIPGSYKTIKCGPFFTVLLSLEGDISTFGTWVPFSMSVYFFNEDFQQSFSLTKSYSDLYSIDGAKFKSISVGYEHIVAISTDNKLYMYGNNNYQQFGNEILSSSTMQRISNIPANKTIVDAFASGFFSFLIMNCADGYYGNDCERWSCQGYDSTDEASCGEGQCVAPNTCQCPANDYVHSDGRCIPVCFGVASNKPEVCRHKGRCVSPNTCRCDFLLSTIECEYNLYAIVSIAVSPVVISIIAVLFFVVVKLLTRFIKQREVQGEMRRLLALNIEKSNQKLDEVDNKQYLIQFEHLEFIDRIAQGNFGVVFKGKYMGSIVAIKLLKADPYDEISEEFLSEVAVLKRLRHTNIIQFLGVCVTSDNKLIVTELMDGLSLDIVLFDKKRKQPISLHKKLQILIEIASGMLYLHSMKPPLIHRDLKSPNILIDKNLTKVKLCDFGISRFDSTLDGLLTGNVGTTAYIAPEVLNNRRYDKRCDVYSFGIVMHEILFENRAFEHETMFTILQKVSNGERPYIDRDLLISSVHLSYVKLMEQCWAGDVIERPSFMVIIDELELMLSNFERPAILKGFELESL
ncbi:serine/threonine-protein kinase CTR1 [Acrasis kona]|uniref:Serine/threonine-protein kinase CTR1 n=1 Tax=Acrasis kona TaxID=1008807 RepID=A0AAW2YWU4_9EUKA